MVRSLIGVASCAFLTGCASYSLTPITPAQAAASWEGETRTEGYIFYEPELVFAGVLKRVVSETVNGQEFFRGEYEFTPTYIRDQDRPYRFTRKEFFAKSDLKITFADGWRFTGAESSTDTTAALTAIADIVKAGIGIAGEAAGARSGADLPPFIVVRPILSGNKLQLQKVAVDWPPTK